MISYAECTARERLAKLLDAGSFHEWLPPSERLTSPHLAQLGVPSAFDDGVAIGRGLLGGRTVFVAAQKGAPLACMRRTVQSAAVNGWEGGRRAVSTQAGAACRSGASPG